MKLFFYKRSGIMECALVQVRSIYPDPLTDWWHGPNHDLDQASAMTGYARHQIRDLGKTTFKFRYWRNQKGAVNLLALEEVFLLRVFKALDGVVAGRTAGSMLMPSIIDYARRAMVTPELMQKTVQFCGWPNQKGGWTWIEVVDERLPKGTPDFEGACAVVIDASLLLHRFLRDVLRVAAEGPMADVLSSVPAEEARGVHVH